MSCLFLFIHGFYAAILIQKTLLGSLQPKLEGASVWPFNACGYTLSLSPIIIRDVPVLSLSPIIIRDVPVLSLSAIIIRDVPVLYEKIDQSQLQG